MTYDIGFIQVGYGNWGKTGLQKLAQLTKNGIPNLDANVYLLGVADKNEERRNEAKAFLRSVNLDYTRVLKDFDEALELAKLKSEELKPIIYDASDTKNHTTHLRRTVNENIFYLGEKPPCLYKRQLDEISDLPDLWSIDLIEEQNPAVIAVVDYIKNEKITPRAMRFYRMNSIGIAKTIQPYRTGVEGGAFLDKIVHDAGVAFAVAGNVKKYEVSDANADYLMIDSIDNKKLVTVEMQPTKEINAYNADAQMSALGKLYTKDGNEIELYLYGGWFGVPKQVKKEIGKIGRKAIAENPNKIEEKNIGFNWEELRYFEIQAYNPKGEEIKLYGNMLPLRTGWQNPGAGFFAYVEKNGALTQLNIKPHDQLLKVFENAVRKAIGNTNYSGLMIGKKEAIKSMEYLFNAREKALSKKSKANYEEEVRETIEYVGSLTYSLASVS